MISYTIGIVGGTGSMGRWFERFFSETGHRILIAGRKTPLKIEDLAKKSDVVILSVPLEPALDLAEKIGPMLSKNQLLMDVCSLKENILSTMNRFTRAEVIGTHPLFGPSSDSIRGQNIIVCQGRGAQWLGWLESEFRAQGAIVTRMDPVEHDRNMAVIQGLTHLLSICMGRTLQKLGMTPDLAILSSTPVFRIKMNLIGRLFAQDLDLYKNLIGQNKYVEETLEAFLSSMEEGKDCLLSGKDKKTLFLESIRDFLGEFSQEGFDESNRIIKALFKEMND